jgi:hypothetical protein
MFIWLWWIILLQIKSYGVMVKELNLQNKNERFKFSHLQPKDYLNFLFS